MDRSNQENGLHEGIEKAVAAIHLKTVCAAVAHDCGWGAGKIEGIEKEYKNALAQFALAFEGVGVVSCLKNDVVMIWQAHCAEGQKFASDMHSLAKTVLQYRGKSLDQKFPGQAD